MGILNGGAGAGLPQLTKIAELDKCVEALEKSAEHFEKMTSLKGMLPVRGQVKDCVDTLKEAQQHLLDQDLIGKNIATQPAFVENIKQVQQQTDGFVHQVSKYNGSNLLKKSFIVDKVRMKLVKIGVNLNLLHMQIQAFYTQPILSGQYSEPGDNITKQVSNAILDSISSIYQVPQSNRNHHQLDLPSPSYKDKSPRVENNFQNEREKQMQKKLETLENLIGDFETNQQQNKQEIERQYQKWNQEQIK